MKPEDDSKINPVPWIITGMVILLVIMFSAGTPAVDQSSPHLSSVPAGSEKPLAASAVRNWTYETSEDKVQGKIIGTAVTTSMNQIDFASPYSGGSRLSITVRQHPRWGTDVILGISNGHMICRSYEDRCYAMVRFDDDPPRRFNLSEPSDYSNDSLFIRNDGEFISLLRKAERAVVEVEFYQEGRPQFVFDVAGLEWPMKIRKPTTWLPQPRGELP